MGEAKSIPSGKSPGGAKRAPQRSSVLYWLGELFSNRAKELVAGAVLTIAGVLTFTTWGIFEQRFNSYIIDAAVAELGRDDSRLAAPIEKIFERVRKAEVGALNAGNFWLTPSNRAYTLYIYFPDGHDGKLFYRLNGASENRYVVLVLQYVKAQAGLEGQGIEGIIERPGALKDLRAITFQLAGSEVDQPYADPGTAEGAGSPRQGVLATGIEVNYVSFVAPAIRIEK
jgi:hypothetical protein